MGGKHAECVELLPVRARLDVDVEPISEAQPHGARARVLRLVVTRVQVEAVLEVPRRVLRRGVQVDGLGLDR